MVLNILYTAETELKEKKDVKLDYSYLKIWKTYSI